jgi:predicted RNase H-like HicB family nuclease
MKKNRLKTKALRHTKRVEWSEEDGCFVGSAPPLIGPCCHGDDKAKVFADLSQIVDEWKRIIITAPDKCPNGS